MSETITQTAKETAEKMVPASTEISPEANARVQAFVEREDRSRAYVLRLAIHEWAKKQPSVNTKKL